MSQPPQQPGPYGRPPHQAQQGSSPEPNAPGRPDRPGGFGAPVPFGQDQFGQDQFAPDQFTQGQFGQPGGGFQQQPGFPQSGHSRFGHPAEFPQAGYPQPAALPPGYRVADEVVPRQRRTGLIVGLAVAVVAAVGAGTAAYLLFFHKPNAEALSPDQVVSGFAHSYTALAHSMSPADLTRAKVYLCDKDQVALQGIYDHERATGGADSSFSLTTSGPVSTNGNTGTFTLMITDKGAESQHQQGTLAKQNGRWLVCGTLSGQ
jgi:hypothetical protein